MTCTQVYTNASSSSCTQVVVVVHTHTQVFFIKNNSYSIFEFNDCTQTGVPYTHVLYVQTCSTITCTGTPATLSILHHSPHVIGPALYLFFFYHARFLRPFRGAGSLLVLLPRRNNLMAPAPPPRAAPFFDVG